MVIITIAGLRTVTTIYLKKTLNTAILFKRERERESVFRRFSLARGSEDEGVEEISQLRRK